jgi:transposase InsO family protein
LTSCFYQPTTTLVRRPLESAPYACAEYATVLATHRIQPSMSRVGNPYDNAQSESFMKTLKQEEIDGRDYRDLNHANTMIGAFIEEVYNRRRLHSALAYQPPAEFEANLHQDAAAPGRLHPGSTATCP